MAFTLAQIVPDSQIGPYTVLRLLGAGGMGQVYLARHRHLGRDAAIKVLLPQISMDENVVARFFTEARATAQLRHPNIVEVFDCDVLPDGRAYIVMECLDGESLRSTLDRLNRLAPDYTSIAALSGLVADALRAAHNNGIVHRDLKPDNTYLTIPPNQRDLLTVKVLDFGIAKLLSGGNPGQGATRTGSLVGTPLYMSPEQCRGLSTIDHSSDIYSLGCLMFEMVAGRPPFVSEAPGDILMAHVGQSAPALSSLDPDVPPEIENLVAQMLAKDPGQRPASMAEVADQLGAFLGLGIAEFHTALQRPRGFSGSAGGSTAILSPEAASTPRRTPAPPKSGNRSRPGALTPNSTAKLPSTLRPIVSTRNGRGNTTAMQPARAKWPLVAIPLALVAVAGGVWFVTRPESKTSVPPVAETEVKPEPARQAAPPPPVAPPAQVVLNINTTPIGAEIWFAEETAARGVSPRKLTVPRSEAPLQITLKADGHSDKVVAIDATRDQTIDVSLEPKNPVGERRPPRRGSSARNENKRPGTKSEDTPSVEFKLVGD
jgi:serine/threonine-protein kinase